MVTPKSWPVFDAKSVEQKLFKRQPVPNYGSSRYEVERIWAPARDGVKVPVALVHKKGLARDGKAPLLLYAYGSYRHAVPHPFNSNPFSLVDRGLPFPVAHIPGWADRGQRGHDQGRGL